MSKAKKSAVLGEPKEPVAVEVATNPPTLFDPEPTPPPVRPDDGIPALDGDLTAEQKAEFVKLLNQYMPVEARARQLVVLAKFTDTKRAPVALRAIQEINALTSMSGVREEEETSMFVVGDGTKIAVQVNKVEK